MAPRLTPPGYMWRVAAVAVITWAVVVLGMSFLIATPLLVGRGVMCVLAVPSHYWHDPLCVCVGVMVLQALVRVWRLSGRFVSLLLTQAKYFDTRTWAFGTCLCVCLLVECVVKCTLSLRAELTPPPGVYVFATLLVVLPLCIGMLYTALVHFPSPSLPDTLPSVVSVTGALRCYFLGLLALLWLAVSCERLLTRVEVPVVLEEVQALGVLVDSLELDMSTRQRHGEDGLSINGDLFIKVLKLVDKASESVGIKQFIGAMGVVLMCVVLEANLSPSPSVFNHLPVEMFRFCYWSHLLVYTGTVVVLIRFLTTPMATWLEMYYRTIKDENYLVGVELENSEDVSGWIVLAVLCIAIVISAV